MESSSTPVQTGSVTPVEGSPASQASSTRSGSIVFTSPFEDTSGLDVFAQIAASAHPLPVRRSSTTVGATPVAPAVNSIVHQSQSQIAQSIYQSQQAIRMQQNQNKRDSIDSTVSKFDPKIEDEYDDEFDSDDDDIEFDSESEQGADLRYRRSSLSTEQFKSNSKSSLLLDTPIKEETESDLMMDVDHSINFHQRRRSPSLSTDSNDLVNSTTNNTQMYARRLSAPENNISTAGGYSTRRVIHNICERKRRENIRDGFSQLQNRLPPHLANNSKLSKMEILNGAKNLINEIRGRIASLSAEISALTQVSEQMGNLEP